MPQAITETLRRHTRERLHGQFCSIQNMTFPPSMVVRCRRLNALLERVQGAVIDAEIQLLAFKSPTFTVPKDVTVDSRLRGNDKAVILANAGIQLWLLSHSLLKHPKTLLWIPAYAGMTKELESYCGFPPTRE
jgi:hypothetical protein